MEQGSTKVLHKNPKDKEEKTVYPSERKLGKVTKPQSKSIISAHGNCRCSQAVEAVEVISCLMKRGAGSVI